jgi:hypothetical protein
MSKCRMCSHPLTRPGRLCRECERELARARQRDEAMGSIETVIADDAARAAEPTRPSARLRARNVVLLAFCVGLLGAAGLRFTVFDEHPTQTRSVMLDPALHAASAVPGDKRGRVTPR